jgi:YndJ-like protein
MKRSLVSALLGAMVWLATPWLPVGSPPAFASLEHVFVFWPLVAAPLAFALAATMLEPSRARLSLYCVARRVQPAASAMVLASFLVDKGPIAGSLASGWLVLALLILLGGLPRVARGAGPLLSGVNLRAAHVFLPLGAVWLVLSRLGVAPPALGPLRVFLAAVHFHFSGVTLEILLAATGRELGTCAPRLGVVQRVLAIGAVAGIPLIVAGRVLGIEPLRAAGVAAILLSTIALAMTSTAVAVETPASTARRLLFASAASLAAAMIVATVYGVGELTGAPLLDLDRMVKAHGLLNALGFVLCGLGGHLARSAPDEARSSSAPLRRRGRDSLSAA